MKYPEAENSFKMALGIDAGINPCACIRTISTEAQRQGGHRRPDRYRNSRNAVGGAINNAQSRTPDIKGVSWASLGVDIAHEGKIKDAQEAFDNARRRISRHKQHSFGATKRSCSSRRATPTRQLAAAEKAIALDPAARSVVLLQGAGARFLGHHRSQNPADAAASSRCADAYHELLLSLDPNGPYSADAKGVLTGAGIPVKAGKKCT